MNIDRPPTVLSSMSRIASRSASSANHQAPCSSQTKSVKSPINQFYCNICFGPLMVPQNIHRASFVTSCGHFYCEPCAQSSTQSNDVRGDILFLSSEAFQGLMPTCKICQCSSANLTCLDLRKVTQSSGIPLSLDRCLSSFRNKQMRLMR